MKELLDTYLKISKILEESKVEVMSSYSPFGPGVTLVSKETGKVLTISERCRHHMHKPESLTFDTVQPKLKPKDKSLIEKYRTTKSAVFYQKLYKQLERGIDNLIISLFNTHPHLRSKWKFKILAAEKLPEILQSYEGTQEDLEKSVLLELKTFLEKSIVKQGDNSHTT